MCFVCVCVCMDFTISGGRCQWSFRKFEGKTRLLNQYAIILRWNDGNVDFKSPLSYRHCWQVIGKTISKLIYTKMYICRGRKLSIHREEYSHSWGCVGLLLDLVKAIKGQNCLRGDQSSWMLPWVFQLTLPLVVLDRLHTMCGIQHEVIAMTTTLTLILTVSAILLNFIEYSRVFLVL